MKSCRESNPEGRRQSLTQGFFIMSTVYFACRVYSTSPIYSSISLLGYSESDKVGEARGRQIMTKRAKGGPVWRVLAEDQPGAFEQLATLRHISRAEAELAKEQWRSSIIQTSAPCHRNGNYQGQDQRPIGPSIPIEMGRTSRD